MRILVVDDEVNIRRILQVTLEKAGYAVVLAEGGFVAQQLLQEQAFDVVLSDVTMPGMTGYQLLQENQKLLNPPPFILMTAFGTIPDAIQSIRDGAFEYVTKPFDLDHLKKVIAGAVRNDPIGQPQIRSTVKKSSEKMNASNIIVESPVMKEVFETVAQVAPSKATVMLGGESGVGKEVVAKALHELSGRKGAFIAVSCAALPETLLESELFGYEKGAFTGANGEKVGRFEAAEGGTLFLDEIGEIPLSMQVKLLRVLQEREVERLGAKKPTPINVRVVTATHRNLENAVEAGTFRLDLLYRLQVVEIYIPSLRDRKEDIAPLASYFLEKFCHENGRSRLKLSTTTAARIEGYSWPGNVRELENAMERAVVLAPESAVEIDEFLLPKNILKAA